MATLREYYDADFNYAVRIHIKLKSPSGSPIEGAVLYDFAGYNAFLICPVPGADRRCQFFRDLVVLNAAGGKVEFDKLITLPSVMQFPGELHVENQPSLEIKARFHGEPDWISSKQIQTTRRIFIYSETQLCDEEILKLKDAGRALDREVQIRSLIHAARRSEFEKPLAFICHDSRDKAPVAGLVAKELQRLMCPVWYDEYSLTVGDNLHDKIMSGLKNCKKCILVLSPNFFANSGWTKREFESIFTREIMEEKQLVLPIWYGVSKKDVYDYSPSLANVLGLDWMGLGEKETCRRLAAKILADEG
jgi:hypothetical protein